MVAVVRGERSPATPRSKTASATRAPAQHSRARSQQTAYTPKAPADTPAGIGPRMAVGIAVVVIGAVAAGAVALAHRGEHPAVAPQASLLGRALAPLGFTLRSLDVQGASEPAKADILRAIGLVKGQPIVGIRLDDLRKQIETGGWVKEAKVVRLLPDTLIIAVVPRTPLAVWQHGGVTRVVDAEGKIMGGADPGHFADLPLVVGEGADQEAGAILPLLRGRPKLMTQLDALIRVDGRRWDLRLKNGAIIELPAVGADSALIQLDQLDQKERVLDLGFERIDMRNPDMVAVRPKASAAQAASPGAAAPAKKS